MQFTAVHTLKAQFVAIATNTKTVHHLGTERNQIVLKFLDRHKMEYTGSSYEGDLKSGR